MLCLTDVLYGRGFKLENMVDIVPTRRSMSSKDGR